MTSIGLSQWIHDMDKYSYKYDDTRIGALGCNFSHSLIVGDTRG